MRKLVLYTCAFLVACATLPSKARLAECKLDALRVLPADPEQATVADARDVIQRLRACNASEQDGGP